ncbi:hypothetical protein [Burkholderia vietnamiensis]|jgi:DNA-directed RNA polymerase subunit RPC12/RpoP|uniref:hypothetical protein n=1 Tax=Burkholderia vietnamiensis TaxID=60552 RepID=UPI001ABA2F63
MDDVIAKMHEMNNRIREKYERMHGGKNNCPECGEEFEVTIWGDDYPNQENEVIHCPYCSKTVGYVRTSGIVDSNKIK